MKENRESISLAVRNPTVNENSCAKREFSRHLLFHSGLYNRARGGEKGRVRWWCENTFRREIPGPSFRCFNCFVPAAFRAGVQEERMEASETAHERG